MKVRSAKPEWNFCYEGQAFRRGADYVGGLDEVGRGAWAGPVCVGLAVVNKELLEQVRDNDALREVTDSKKLSAKKREKIYSAVSDAAIEYQVGAVSAQTIDRIGLISALKLASSRAYSRLRIKPHFLFIDGDIELLGGVDSKTLIGGDKKCWIISLASIIAKVERDAIMDELSKSIPYYGFESNKGYGTKSHYQALCGFGPSSIHRLTWSYIEKLPWDF